MSKQCLNISQMQHLKDLGVHTSKASMYWVRLVRLPKVKNKEKEVLIDWFLDLQKEHMHVGYDEYECFPTFTLQDILDLLPSTISIETTDEINEYWLELGVSERNKSYWFVQYRSIEDSIYVIRGNENLIDAAYEMLCWCIENGYIKTSKEE